MRYIIRKIPAWAVPRMRRSVQRPKKSGGFKKLLLFFGIIFLLFWGGILSYHHDKTMGYLYFITGKIGITDINNYDTEQKTEFVKRQAEEVFGEKISQVDLQNNEYAEVIFKSGLILKVQLRDAFDEQMALLRSAKPYVSQIKDQFKTINTSGLKMFLNEVKKNPVLSPTTY